jgi:hypothetical protein
MATAYFPYFSFCIGLRGVRLACKGHFARGALPVDKFVGNRPRTWDVIRRDEEKSDPLFAAGGNYPVFSYA